MTSQVQTNPAQSQQETTPIVLPKVSGPDGYLFAMAEMLAGVYSSTQKGSTENTKQQQTAAIRALLEQQMGEIHSFDGLQSWVENLMKFDKNFSPEIQNFLNNVKTQLSNYPGMKKGGPGTAAYNSAAGQYYGYQGDLKEANAELTSDQTDLSKVQQYVYQYYISQGKPIPTKYIEQEDGLQTKIGSLKSSITKLNGLMQKSADAMHAAVVESQATYLGAAETSAKSNGTAANMVLTGCKTFTSAAQETQKSFQSAIDAIGTLLDPAAS